MEVDLVYTWVNPHDETRNAQRASFSKGLPQGDRAYQAGVTRYQSRDEIKFSVENAIRCLPFIRRVFIVCGGPPAEWMEQHNLVTTVDQDDILPSEIVPVFQSDIIEAFLFKIPGLSEHYIYSNDDYFIARLHHQNEFFDDLGHCIVGIEERFLGQWERRSSVYADMELNACRALSRHLKLQKYTGFGVNSGNSLLHHRRARLRSISRRIPLLNSVTHVAQPYIRSTWMQFHELFAEEIGILGGSKFRSRNGFTINLMYHHFSRSLGLTSFRHAPDHLYLDGCSSLEAKSRLARQLLDHVDAGISRFCLNDTGVQDVSSWNEFADAMMIASQTAC